MKVIKLCSEKEWTAKCWNELSTAYVLDEEEEKVNDGVRILYKNDDFTVIRSVLLGDEFIEICDGKAHITYCPKDKNIVVNYDED